MHTYRQTDIQADRQTTRQADKQTARQTDRQPGRQTDRDRQTGRQTGRQTHRQTVTILLQQGEKGIIGIDKRPRFLTPFRDPQNHGDHFSHRSGQPHPTIEARPTEQPGSGNLLFISGQIPKMPDNSLLKGWLGSEGSRRGSFVQCPWLVSSPTRTIPSIQKICE